MTKANEAYLTTKNELATSKIEFDEGEQIDNYLYNFMSLVELEMQGPRVDDYGGMEFKVMTRGSIGDKFSLIETQDSQLLELTVPDGK
ncbi:14263_t:CDS:2 [Gigaspora margarita]|uniref:14263_t:CDS:1 n=1 Tax=Gigaspora margarita TaxID=4874 RepID=A0ABN7U858_GIGMA|nr:14263_t:CDS:2 [Gigaspora margarita]